jgi:alanine-synthesizing transaminase
MRRNIVHPGADELHYEIRGIVEFAESLADTGISITWENIGDPIFKGEEVPLWIREIVADEVKNNVFSYAYSPTKGLQAAREWLAVDRSKQGTELKAENIMFFNGLGDAINKVYNWLNPEARVLGPNPAYPTHSAFEAAHAHSAHLTYQLDPNNHWLPDTADIRKMVAGNKNIVALLMINPDNPTGTVYPRAILEEFMDIAREYDLFLIADEIYANLTHHQPDFISLGALTTDVPMLIMRGLSKEVPWPGSRCGWLEFYNLEANENFARYAKSIEEAKMTEVCSTTLPQSVLPIILDDPRYRPHLEKRRKKYAARAHEAVAAFAPNPYLNAVLPKGAFYQAVTFSDTLLAKPFITSAANLQAQALLDDALATIPAHSFDKRFCHQLLAATGICTVPLTTGFNSSTPGFRMTLLEEDDATFTRTLQVINDFASP